MDPKVKPPVEDGVCALNNASPRRGTHRSCSTQFSKRSLRTHHSQSLCSIHRGLRIQTQFSEDEALDREPAAKQSQKTSSITRSAKKAECKLEAQQLAQVRVTLEVRDVYNDL